MKHTEELMHHFNLYFGSTLILLLTGALGWALSRYLKKPYTIVLVIVGLVIGLANFPFFRDVTNLFTKSENFSVLILSFFLPALLGEAAMKLPFPHLKENRKSVLILAMTGTIITFLAVAAGSYYILHLSLVVSFTFGALMSPTDPISVLAIFKSLGVNKKLSTTIEGESLLNDGVAVVLFKIATVYLLSYIDMGAAGFAAGIWMFVKVAAGGAIIGGIAGYLTSHFIKYIDDFPLETIISFILFYGVYIISEVAGVSGVIAVVVSALIFGNYGRKIGMTPVTKLNINNFWEIIAFIANTIIFLMVGMEIRQFDFSGKWLMVLLAILIVLAARSIAVYVSMIFIRNYPAKYQHVLNWGGLKGSLSIALALSLPYSFKGREDVLVLAFSVVLFSLLIQGLTIEPLIKKLGVISKNKTEREYEKQIAAIHRAKAAIHEINELTEKTYTAKPIYQEELEKHHHKINLAYQKLETLFNTNQNLKQSQLHFIKERALYAEYDEIEKLVQEGLISSKEADKEKKVIIEEIVHHIQK